MSRSKQSETPSVVGYGRPPIHTRFKKGQSGNPSGRPHGSTTGRVKDLVLKEAYRMVRVKEGDTTVALPAVQAILRAQIALAAKGNGPAQRAVITSLEAIEKGIAEVAASAVGNNPEPKSEFEVARRIAFVLERAARKLEAEKKKGPPRLLTGLRQTSRKGPAAIAGTI